ncbi:MAG: hypothetical protein ACE5NC_00075 [Anaerolineae bacterium]
MQANILAADERRSTLVGLHQIGFDRLRSPLLDADLIGANRLAPGLTKGNLFGFDALGAALDHLDARCADLPDQLILELDELGAILAVGNLGQGTPPLAVGMRILRQPEPPVKPIF